MRVAPKCRSEKFSCISRSEYTKYTIKATYYVATMYRYVVGIISFFKVGVSADSKYTRVNAMSYKNVSKAEGEININLIRSVLRCELTVLKFIELSDHQPPYLCNILSARYVRLSTVRPVGCIGLLIRITECTVYSSCHDFEIRG